MPFARRVSQLRHEISPLREVSQARAHFLWAADLLEDLLDVDLVGDATDNFHKIKPNGWRSFSRKMASGHFLVGTASQRVFQPDEKQKDLRM